MSDNPQLTSKNTKGVAKKSKQADMVSSMSTDNEPLPWWVELLFVQIGLPDNWLRLFLKTRKRVRRKAIENKGGVVTMLVALIALIYIDPILYRARVQKRCISGAKEYIQRRLESNDMLDRAEKEALAVNFCNGGRLP